MAEDARERLEEILSQDEYQAYEQQEDGFIQSVMNRISEWFSERLGDLMMSFTPTGPGSAFGIFVIIAGFAALLVLLILITKRRVGRRRLARDAKPFNASRTKNMTYRDHLNEAFDCEQQSDYTEASRHLFLALLLYFHHIQWLEAKTWKTNWEYYEELRKTNREGADFFNEFVQLFDHVTYGEREVAAAEYERYRNEAMRWLAENESAASPAVKEGDSQ